MLYQTQYNSPIGKILLVSNEQYLIGLWIEGQKYFANTINNQEIKYELTPVLKETTIWLDNYFQGKNPNLKTLPLLPNGSEFQKNVWNILCTIPYGKTMTYGEIANLLSKKKHSKVSAQAVGNAVGHNPISIIIPCHRVVGKDGNLTGYAGGIDKKIKLLELEGLDMEQFYVPK